MSDVVHAPNNLITVCDQIIGGMNHVTRFTVTSVETGTSHAYSFT